MRGGHVVDATQTLQITRKASLLVWAVAGPSGLGEVGAVGSWCCGEVSREVGAQRCGGTEAALAGYFFDWEVGAFE
jgi:hypothetical protein